MSVRETYVPQSVVSPDEGERSQPAIRPVLLYQARSSRGALLRRLLGEQLGAVAAVRSEAELVELAGGARLAVVDLPSAGRLAPELIGRLVESCPDLPVLAIGDSRRAADAVAAMREGAWDCIFYGTQAALSRQLRTSALRLAERGEAFGPHKEGEIGQQSELLSRDLISTASHDLKGPLGSILTSVELLVDGTAGSERQNQIHVCIASCARNALSIVDTLLSAQQIADGVMPHRPQRCPASTVLLELAAEFAPLAEAKQITLEPLLNGAAEAELDPAGLRRVAANLLQNALKFTPAGGWVKLFGGLEEGCFVLRVEDSGPGISPEAQRTLFQRWGRPQSSHSPGTGLGLYICRNIVEAHGGRITVASRPGIGAAFTALFPQEGRR